MMNMGNMLKQFQTMQKKLKEAQQELSEKEIGANAGNGLVSVVCDGQGKFKSIKLSKESINSEDPESVDDETVEMLEDLITTAMKNATDKATSYMETKMKSLTGGINIPGLF